MLTYDKRNRLALLELAPNTKKAAMEWYEYCVKNNIDILITDAGRTYEEQKVNLASGASHTMKSYHLVGQALDFVPIVNGKADYTQYGRLDIIASILYAKQLGFTWGGNWTTFVDKPHLQFDYKGYGTDKVLDAIAPALSDAVIAEIKRKAHAGVQLVDANTEKNKIYTSELVKEYKFQININGNTNQNEVNRFIALGKSLGLKVTVVRG